MHQVQAAWKVNEAVQLNGILAYTNYKRKTETTSHDFTKNADVLTTGMGEQDLSKFNNIGFKTTLQYKLTDAISFQPGIDINHDEASGARIAGRPAINDYAL